MNERIEELAEQCGIEKYNQHGDLIEFGFDYEKFAELIVRECAKYVDVMWPHQKEFKGTLDVGKGLKAKFGVKE